MNAPLSEEEVKNVVQGPGDVEWRVCIRDAKEAFSVRPRFTDQFIYLTLDVEDNEEQNLIRLFPAAKTFIDNAISQGGISLSPAFVVMFVMQHYQLSWEDALHMLKEYEAIYRASIAVAAYPNSNRTISRRKRTDEDDDDGIDRYDDRKRALVDNTQGAPPPASSLYDPDAMEIS
ncbi:hypothetical protein B0H10DRAFT_2215781 [Mycena sp. CBHHK59/15]|nr:hypothetical protein B0H10DRAFT_2215781 [Mycena sp. CBHHK59/15]